MADVHALLQDPKIEAVLERAYREWKTQRRQLIWRFLPLLPRFLFKRKMDWQDMFARTKDMYLPLEAEQGGLLYVAARAIGARRIAEYGTSFGVSTLYLAAAARDNGGGTVIGTEILPEKAEVARANFAEAGVGEFIDLRVGDARETLKDCGGPVSPTTSSPSRPITRACASTWPTRGTASARSSCHSRTAWRWPSTPGPEQARHHRGLCRTRRAPRPRIVLARDTYSGAASAFHAA